VSAKRVIVLDLVCLTAEHLQDETRTPTLSRLASEGWAVPLIPPFPAVTCTAQATLTTGAPPREHGVICNGMYERDRYVVRFWDQPTSMVKREKLWERLRRADQQAKTALLFFQNTMFAQADIVVTPAPLHEEHELVPWCYSKPVGYYEQLAERLGPFDLSWYWGPLAGSRSSDWIARAALETIRDHQPTMTWVYLPHLDYNTQRFGPKSQQFEDDLRTMDGLVKTFLDDLKGLGPVEETAIIVLSEYAMGPVSRPIFLNRMLREAGLLAVREIGGREYLDLELSRAFAMVDHQIAHLYFKSDAEREVRDALEGKPGIQTLLDDYAKGELAIDHPSSGDLIAVADADAWFPYYWWLADEKAPPFARTVDIHRKPGYDPVELFFDPATKSIPLDASLVKGSHGRPHDLDPARPVLIAYGPGLPRKPTGEVPATAVPDLILGVLGYRESPPREPSREELEEQLRQGGQTGGE
jgi:predicted AlkP superfamily pyrophosphatase or phosphodiesterase